KFRESEFVAQLVNNICGLRKTFRHVSNLVFSIMGNRLGVAARVGMTNIVDGLTNIIPVAPMLEDLVELVAHQFLADTESKTTPFRVGITKRTFHDRLGTIVPKNNGGRIVEDDFLDTGASVGHLGLGNIIIGFGLIGARTRQTIYGVQDIALGQSRSLKALFASFFGLGVSLRVHRGDESDRRMVGRNIGSIVVDPVAIVTRKNSAFMAETVNIFLFVHKYHSPLS